ncbi:MAG: TAXI family TRAP transporter solute-binding subunit [Planctomycetota bacterium]|jgi:TRAP transporter TAXI family solute receptor
MRMLRPKGLGWKIWLVAIGLFVGVAFLVWPLMPPPLPKTIRIGTGPAEGRYRVFGARLAQRLEAQGFAVELVASAGSIENLARLRGEKDSVDLALVQGGVVDPERVEGVRGIGSLFYEPIWIFHRKSDPFELVSDLRGKRIAIGEPGSGTAPLARHILDANGVRDGDEAGSRFVRLGGKAGLRALHGKEVDATILVQAPTTEWVHDLVEESDLAIMLFVRAEAYAARFRYLDVIRVPRGFVDFERDVPSRDIQLLATTANLLVREDAHPGLVPLLIEACSDELAQGTMLAAPGTFPSVDRLDVPVAERATQYYRQGPSILYRHMPFQLAHALNRLVILLIPLLTLLYPLSRGAGPLYRFIVNRKIYPWYAVLRDLEEAMSAAETAEERAEIVRQLEILWANVAAVHVPARYTGELFTLRRHVALAIGRAKADVNVDRDRA